MARATHRAKVKKVLLWSLSEETSLLGHHHPQSEFMFEIFSEELTEAFTEPWLRSFVLTPETPHFDGFTVKVRGSLEGRCDNPGGLFRDRLGCWCCVQSLPWQFRDFNGATVQITRYQVVPLLQYFLRCRRKCKNPKYFQIHSHMRSHWQFKYGVKILHTLICFHSDIFPSKWPQITSHSVCFMRGTFSPFSGKGLAAIIVLF